MSRVRIYQCTTYKKQNILSPDDEPLELHTWGDLLFVSTKCSFIEIYNMNSLRLVARFGTISRAETIIYSEFGNCIVTLERDNDILHCFVRLYMGFPCQLIDLVTDNSVIESFLMLDREVDVTDRIDRYLTDGMTIQDLNMKERKEKANELLESWDVERVELPTQGAVNCVGMCSHTGFMAVAWDTSITLYVLTQDSDSSRPDKPKGKPIRCGVTILMEMEIGFVVTKVVLEDVYLACLSEFEVQAFKLGLMPGRYTRVPKEKKLDQESRIKLGVETEDDNEPEIPQSEDFIQLRSFYSYPALHLNARSNGGETDCQPSILEINEEGDTNQAALSGVEEHCIIFPSVSKEKMHISNKDEQNKRMMEIWGPRRLTGNKALKVTTPDGHKLTNSGISTMLYLKLPYTIGKSNEYSLSTATNDQGDKSIDVFHTIKLVPEYIYEGDKRHLVGICLLVASKKEGHFYDILEFCRKIITFPFTKDLIDILLSPGLMHVVYLSRIEVYITRSYGVASENVRNLVKQGKIYDIDFASSDTTPVDQYDSTIPFSKHGTSGISEIDIPTPVYWLHQVSPQTQEVDISQIGQSSFVNLTSCTNTNNRIAILSKLKPEVKSIAHSFGKLVRKNSPKIEESVWSIYILDIVPLHSIAKQMELMAQPYISENPPIYFQLICDAHFLRKSGLSGTNNALWDENEVECTNVEGSVDSVVISLNPSQTHLSDEPLLNQTEIVNRKQLMGLKKSCLLIADFLRQENEQLALEYYRQGSHDINQFLQNSIFHMISPVSEDALSDSIQSSISPSILRDMANTMCFNQSDASSLAKSIMQMESLQPENSSKTNDSIVFKIFNLYVHLENNDELKAKESASDLFLHSKEFSTWANEHINSLVSKDGDGNLSLLAMFLLIETPSLVVPLFPQMCQMELVKAGNIIELVKHNTEDVDQDEMVILFITDLIRLQASVEKKIADLELAITELVILCFKLFEFQIEMDTRQFDNVCAEFRPNWVDNLPPFGENQGDNLSLKGTEFILMVQNIMCSPFNNPELSEKILELTTSSAHYEGIKAILFLKLSRYKELVLIFLNGYQSVFTKLCDSIKQKSETDAIIRCIVNEILVNTGEDDMLSRELRERVCYFIVSLTRHMSYDEIMEVLPEQSPADLYKRCFDFHLHIEMSNLIVQELCESNL